MTTPLAPAITARRTGVPSFARERRVLVPVVIAVAFLLTKGVAQAVTPFIRQDDWPFLLPAGTRGVLPTSYYNISEGRWLNYAWWAVVGQHGGPTIAALTYALGYALLVAGMWRVLHRSGIRPRPAVDVLLGIALFASCVWVQLLYWPGTLTPSVLIAAAAIWLLPWAARTRLRFGLWLVLGEVAAVLTYPPIGVVLLVFAVVYLRDAPWRRVLLMAAAWVAVRTGIAAKPEAYSWRQLCGAGALGGIGFTMSLFIAGIAFPDDNVYAAAKVAIFLASAIAAGFGALILWQKVDTSGEQT